MGKTYLDLYITFEIASVTLCKLCSLSISAASETDLTDFYFSSHRSTADLNLSTIFLELHAPNGKYGQWGYTGNINGK